MEKSRDLEQALFTFMSPEPYVYNPEKKKTQIKKLKNLEKNLNKLRNKLRG